MRIHHRSNPTTALLCGLILSSLLVGLPATNWSVLPSILDAPVELMITDTPEQDHSTVTPAPAPIQTETGVTSATPATDPLTDLTRRLSQELDHVDERTSQTTPTASLTPTPIFQEETPLSGRVHEAATSNSGDSETWAPLEANVLRQAQRIQQQHTDIDHAVRDEDEMALSDIALLWQTAVERSGTIRFAIEKLSRKNATGDVPQGETFTNRMLKSLARVGGVAGTVVTGTPTGLVGGSMVEQMLQESPNTSALTHVTDADMLLLAKEVETLQSSLIQRYYAYRHNKLEWESAQVSQQELDRYLALLPSPEHGGANANKWDPLVPLLESLRTTMDDTVQTAEREYQSSRQALSLLVGPEAVSNLEAVKQHVSTKTK